jgi:chromosome segregation ATPase
MLTHQLEFYKACIAELQKRSGMELIRQDFAVHITRVDEQLDAFRAQNADLPEKFHLVQKYFRDADIQLETCEKQVEQLTQQNNLLKDRLHRLHDELQNLKDEVHRSIRK